MDTKDWKPSRKAGAIKANKELIRVKAQHYPQDKVGIIGFSTDAELLHEPVCLADGLENLNEALESPPSMGSTNFTSALELAKSCLFNKSAPQKKSSGGKAFHNSSLTFYMGPPSKNQTI